MILIKAIYILKKNIETLKVENKIKIYNSDAIDFIKNEDLLESKICLLKKSYYT